MIEEAFTPSNSNTPAMVKEIKRGQKIIDLLAQHIAKLGVRSMSTTILCEGTFYNIHIKELEYKHQTPT